MTPEGWDDLTLGGIAAIRRGASPRPIQSPKWFSEDGPGWVRISDVTKSYRVLKTTKQRLSPLGVTKSVPVHPGDLIMSICGTIGRPVVLGIEACIHDGFVLFDQLSTRCSRDYLRYFLEMRTEHFASLGQPGTQKNLNTSIVKATPIALPPLAEQKKIAEILGSVDEAIQTTQAVIDQTRRVKEGLLQQLLTRGIGHTRFKQTEIGEIPESWEVALLDDLVSAPICYGILMPGRGVPEGIPVIKVKDLKDGRIYKDDLLLTDPDIDEAYRRSRLAGGDILLSIRGTTGRIAMVPEALTGANITQDCARLRIEDSAIRDFVLHCLAAPVLQQQIGHHTIGQAVKGINIAEVRKLRLPLPPPDERARLTSGLQTATDSIQRHSENLDGLLTTKRGLMQDLLTGRVRVAA